MTKISGWIRGRDSSRLLHYEGGGARTPSTDIVCPMYMRVWDIVKIAKDPTEMRPLILCEYVPFSVFDLQKCCNVPKFNPFDNAN